MIVLRSTHRYVVEALEARVRFLEDQVQALQGHLFRVQRRQNGMSEAPRELPPAPKQKPLPSSLSSLVAGFSSSSMRAALVQRIRLLEAEGMNFEDIEERLRKEYEL